MSRQLKTMTAWIIFTRQGHVPTCHRHLPVQNLSLVFRNMTILIPMTVGRYTNMYSENARAPNVINTNMQRRWHLSRNQECHSEEIEEAIFACITFSCWASRVDTIQISLTYLSPAPPDIRGAYLTFRTPHISFTLYTRPTSLPSAPALIATNITTSNITTNIRTNIR